MKCFSDSFDEYLGGGFEVVARWWKEQDGAKKMKPPPKKSSAVVDKSNKSKTEILSMTGNGYPTVNTKARKEQTNGKRDKPEKVPEGRGRHQNVRSLNRPIWISR